MLAAQIIVDVLWCTERQGDDDSGMTTTERQKRDDDGTTTARQERFPVRSFTAWRPRTHPTIGFKIIEIARTVNVGLSEAAVSRQDVPAPLDKRRATDSGDERARQLSGQAAEKREAANRPLRASNKTSWCSGANGARAAD